MTVSQMMGKQSAEFHEEPHIIISASVVGRGRNAKMTERELLSEELLEGWLGVSLSIINERLVSAMTFNESMVCNLLYRQERKEGAPLTATDLCGRLRILKPQMNVILNHLERDGLISRERSSVDKRNVHIRLTAWGTHIYEKAHQEILRLPDGLIERLGEEKICSLVRMLKEVTACFGQMMEEEAASSSEETGDRAETKENRGKGKKRGRRKQE